MRHLDSLSNKANWALEVADDSGGDTLRHHLSSPGWWQEGSALLSGLASAISVAGVSVRRGCTLKIKRLFAVKPDADPTEPPGQTGGFFRRILGS